LEEIEIILEVYQERFVSLSNIPGIKYVLVFKNEGGKAGASIPHAHSQVYALSLLPPEIKREFEAYNDYKLEKYSCPYCDIIKKEEGKNRVIWEDDNFFVLSPFASDSPYGAWFIPKRHVKAITELTKTEKKSLAKAMKLVLTRLDDIDVSYNYFFHNATESSDYHMNLKLEPRPNVWAGLELGTGIIINPIPPEFAAKFYRDEIKLELTEDKKHIKVH
jgi:UDPglucose--hexose-1-phosphate uridylyltransferase